MGSVNRMKNLKIHKNMYNTIKGTYKIRNFGNLNL